MNANRASFNGPNGVKAQPNAQQKAAAANAKKMPPTSQQLARQQAASKDQNLRASANKGKPNADAINSFNKNEGVGTRQGRRTGTRGCSWSAVQAKVKTKSGTHPNLIARAQAPDKPEKDPELKRGWKRWKQIRERNRT